jgi:hypothetical protein
MRLSMKWGAGVGIVCAFLAASVPLRAAACGNSISELDPAVEQLLAAEHALRGGRSHAAVKTIARVFPRIRTEKPGSNALVRRALRIAAVATARLDGQVKQVPAFGADTAAQRAENYAWAVTTLRRLLMQKLEDPALMTDLGEALARRAATHEEAKRMLEHLASRDLMASAEGWAALSRLRAEAGDVSGGDKARLRCTQIARAAVVCGAAQPQGA